MKNIALYCTYFLFTIGTFAQEYQFESIKEIETSSIKDQGNTGTCWSFSTSSFLESEIFRISGKTINLSEMYSVRATYPKKAWNYVMRQGKIQFSEGGLCHDVIDAMRTDGLVPEEAFTGLFGEQKRYNHEKIVPSIKETLDNFIQEDDPLKTPSWKEKTERILNEQIGVKPSSFNYGGKQYTPKSFQEMTGLKAEDYITITSFTHQPYFTSFILNIPDNFSNGTFYNVPLDLFLEISKEAIDKGYSIGLDTDVSEKTFSAKHGIAVIPENNEDYKKILTEIQPEKEINKEYRQKEFENFNTADDHLMHIIGVSKDQTGTKYFKVKNSWGTGERVGNNGFIYMSESYFKLKAISILIHKDALSKSIKKQLKL